jgi:hypothetical protein
VSPADALELLLLEHAQELGLQVEPHLGDLVEEERAAVRALERSLHPLDRAGEGALLVAEERALHQPLRERRAVELDEGPIAPLALVVDGAREELLAGPALALEEDGGTRGRGHRDRLQIASWPALADDLPLVRNSITSRPFQRLVLAAQRTNSSAWSTARFELLGADRLGDVVDRAGLDGGDRVLDARVAR